MKLQREAVCLRLYCAIDRAGFPQPWTLPASRVFDRKTRVFDRSQSGYVGWRPA